MRSLRINYFRVVEYLNIFIMLLSVIRKIHSLEFRGIKIDLYVFVVPYKYLDSL